jgi:hypothetical protein
MVEPAVFARVQEILDQRRVSQARTGRPASFAGLLVCYAKLFAWGHVTEAEYTTERDRLESLRAELMAQSRPAAAGTLRFDGVGLAWRAGSPTERRTLLGTLFERIYVLDGAAVKFVARRKHRDEIEELVAAAIGGVEDESKPGLAVVNGVRVRGVVHTFRTLADVGSGLGKERSG